MAPIPGAPTLSRKRAALGGPPALMDVIANGKTSGIASLASSGGLVFGCAQKL